MMSRIFGSVSVLSPTPGTCGISVTLTNRVTNDSSPSRESAHLTLVFFFPFIFICWRLITLQYCSGFCHTLTRISHGFTCAPHPEPRSHLPAGLLRRTPAQTNLASGMPESESKKVPFRIFYTGDISFLFT